MVCANRSNRYKAIEIVFVRSIVTVPGNNVKGGMVLGDLEVFANVLGDDGVLFFLVFIVGGGVQEVTGISRSVST